MADKKGWYLPDPDSEETKKGLEIQQKKVYANKIRADIAASIASGKFCGKCKHFVDIKMGNEHLIKQGFFEGVFNRHGDGHDFKPCHVGDPSMYSLCNIDDVATHHFHDSSKCRYYKEKGSFFTKIFGGLGK